MAHLEVDVFALLNLSVNPVNLELICVHLGLVVLQLGHHFLELLSALLQVYLIFAKLLGYVWTTLLGKNVLELNVKLFFLLNQDILLRNFLSLRDEALLQTLDLLNKLIRFDVSRFKLSPSMNIQGLLKLV